MGPGHQPGGHADVGIETGDGAPLLFEKRRQPIQERSHVRPLAQADLLADLEEGDRAYQNGVGAGHGVDRAPRQPLASGQAPGPGMGVQEDGFQAPPSQSANSSSASGAKTSGPGSRSRPASSPIRNFPCGMGTSRTTGLFPLAITTSSPDMAASISRESCVLAA